MSHQYQRPPDRQPKVFLARHCWESHPDLEEVIGALFDGCMRIPLLQGGRPAWSAIQQPTVLPADPSNLFFTVSFSYELASQPCAVTCTTMIGMLDPYESQQVCPGGVGSAVTAEFVDSRAWETPLGEEIVTPTLVALDLAFTAVGLPLLANFALIEGTYGTVIYR